MKWVSLKTANAGFLQRIQLILLHLPPFGGFGVFRISLPLLRNSCLWGFPDQPKEAHISSQYWIIELFDKLGEEWDVGYWERGGRKMRKKKYEWRYWYSTDDRRYCRSTKVLKIYGRAFTNKGALRAFLVHWTSKVIFFCNFLSFFWFCFLKVSTHNPPIHTLTQLPHHHHYSQWLIPNYFCEMKRPTASTKWDMQRNVYLMYASERNWAKNQILRKETIMESILGGKSLGCVCAIGEICNKKEDCSDILFFSF